MTNEQLENKANMLFTLFTKLPNTTERANHFSKWIELRNEQSMRIYKNEIK